MGAIFSLFSSFTPLSWIKYGIAAFLALALAAATLTARHYYNAYLDQIKINGETQQALTQFQAAAKTCTDSVEDLRKQQAAQQVLVDQAQAQAAVVAKKNKHVAQSVLQTQQSTPGNNEKSAIDLFQKYKSGAIQ